MMTRRRWFQTAVLGGGGLLAKAQAALSKMKITRVRFYESPVTRPIMNQSFHIITVETDASVVVLGQDATDPMNLGAPKFYRVSLNDGQALPLAQEPGRPARGHDIPACR